MAMFVLMTAGEAGPVRGPSISRPGARLDPIQRKGGMFVLGVEVLTDSAHEAHWTALAPLPQVDGEDPGFPAAIEPEE